MKKYILSIFVLILVAGCTSRLRTELVLTGEDALSRKLSVDQTHFYPESMLGQALTDKKVVSGNHQVAVLTVSTRWLMMRNPDEQFVLNENWKAHLYLQFPETITPAETLSVMNNSFVNLREYYELSREEKAFFPQSGYFMVDSTVGQDMYVSVSAAYQNNTGVSFDLAGDFKIKYLR